MNLIAKKQTVFSQAQEGVRPAAEWVMQQADHVVIHTDKIPAYTEMILSKYKLVTEIPGAHHYVSDDQEKTTAYILALDSINFGSGYFRLAKAAGMSLEYEQIAGGLKIAFEQGVLDTPEKWASVTPEILASIFNLQLGASAHVDNLLEFFAKHLHESGLKIMLEYDGKVLNLLHAANHSAVKLADIVANWTGFYDTASYKGQRIPIMKRAQILAADLYLALKHQAPADFKDMAFLTSFADNMVPHVLHCDGIIEYSPSLTEKIAQGVFLTAGSAEEIEIRCAGIHAVELMRAHHPSLTSVNFDHLLWNRGYEADQYAQLPHQTLTTAY